MKTKSFFIFYLIFIPLSDSIGQQTKISYRNNIGKGTFVEFGKYIVFAENVDSAWIDMHEPLILSKENVVYNVNLELLPDSIKNWINTKWLVYPNENIVNIRNFKIINRAHLNIYYFSLINGYQKYREKINNKSLTENDKQKINWINTSNRILVGEIEECRGCNFATLENEPKVCFYKKFSNSNLEEEVSVKIKKDEKYIKSQELYLNGECCLPENVDSTIDWIEKANIEIKLYKSYNDTLITFYATIGDFREEYGGICFLETVYELKNGRFKLLSRFIPFDDDGINYQLHILKSDYFKTPIYYEKTDQSGYMKFINGETFYEMQEDLFYFSGT